MGFPRLLRIPRPKTFLYLMSLRTGTELATLSLLLNKATGLYGLLALLTGLHLSPLQLSMYLYSVFALILAATLAPHIRTQSPFHCLALAMLHVLDGVVNGLYTVAFGVTWFLVVSQHHSNAATGGKMMGGAGKTMGDAAGFTKPEHNVSSVEVAVGPDQGIPGEKHEAVTVGVGSGSQSSSVAGLSLDHGVLQPEGVSSVVVICALWALRIYFILVVCAYTRLVLRRHVAATSRLSTTLWSGSKDAGYMEDPFAQHLPEGKGWKGKLGRAFVGTARRYWLGADQGDVERLGEEVVMGRLGRSGVGEAPGVVERERRRRSGTGPPPPMPQLQGQQGQHLRVQEVRDG